jgi:hypothetical protein
MDIAGLCLPLKPQKEKYKTRLKTSSANENTQIPYIGNPAHKGY